ncbi:MAG: HAD family hydrolase [Candidatus Omnitrophica bacterium]|nr:HAD family hydrolase [Candidatus Omnitrophota bacterium]
MRKKIAIFDFDGTLIDAYDSIYKTIDFIREKLNYRKFDFEKVKKAVGGGDLKLISNLFNGKDVKTAHLLYRENYLNFLKDNVKVINGVYQFLDELKNKNIKIAGATNRARFSLEGILKETEIGKYFDLVLCIEDVKNPKPDPEMILKIIEKFRIDKKEAFFVGDMDIDYQTGRNAGIDTYIVLTGSCKKEDFLKYENPLIFDNLYKVKKFLIENKLI